MRHTSAALIILLAFSPVAACAQLQGTGTAATGTVTQVAPKAMLAAKKALIAAHALHEAAADALIAAANSNICKSTCASDAKRYLDQSATYLKSADDLVALGDAEGIEAKISGATALLSQIQGLMGKK